MIWLIVVAANPIPLYSVRNPADQPIHDAVRLRAGVPDVTGNDDRCVAVLSRQLVQLSQLPSHRTTPALASFLLRGSDRSGDGRCGADVQVTDAKCDYIFGHAFILVVRVYSVHSEGQDMRCDRFRADMLKKPMTHRKRGERALFVRHANHCVPCWNWMIDMYRRHGGETAGNLAYTKTILDEDNKDPEFLSVVNTPEIIE